MIINDTKEKSLPFDKRILVYAYNIEQSGWYIDEYNKGDCGSANGMFYPHNISHWCELPDDPTTKTGKE